MNKKLVKMSIIIFFIIINVTLAYSSGRLVPLIIDHNCTNLSHIPDKWIDSVQTKFRMYFAHTSHGEQLIVGQERIESTNIKYSVAIGNQVLPKEAGAFCIRDNNQADPEEYWNSDEYQNGMSFTRQVLKENPGINVSMFVWCIQLYMEGETYVQAYLDSISKLEKEFPQVIFIYTTSHTQFAYDPQYNIDGLNRHLRNEQIRKYCRDKNKVLYDFGDLDSWWFNPSTQKWEHHTVVVNGQTIQMQHPRFEGDQAGHTTFESCEQKGKAVWWMLARLAGWEDIVPIELVSFDAFLVDKSVQLTWQTASENNNFGFEIERSSNKKTFKKIGFIKGHGTSNVAQKYEFFDETVEQGNCYYYRLKQLNFNGTFEYSDILTISVGLPVKYNLQQNYPNPFNPETVISFELAQDNFISIFIFDILGKKVKTLVESRQKAGYHEIMWDGYNDNGQRLTSGIYLCQLKVDDKFQDIKKMIMVQ